MVDIDLSLLTISTEEIAIRLGLAMLIGAIVGFEREFSHRPAGLRTHMLVALGACIVMITSQKIFCQYRPFGSTADPGRLSAQVIAGVGFLGAGTILREGVIVKGLTTAASIWAVACMGIAIGAGYYEIAFIAVVYILITLTVFEWFQHKVFRNRLNRYVFALKCTNIVPVLEKVNDMITSKDAKIGGILVADEGNGLFNLSFHTDFAGRHALKRYQEFLTELTQDEHIVSINSENKQ